jgi:hypothetical protein
MTEDNWFIATPDGENYVISNDVSDVPADATPAPLAGPPTESQIETLIRDGAATVVVGKDA